MSWFDTLAAKSGVDKDDSYIDSVLGNGATGEQDMMTNIFNVLPDAVWMSALALMPILLITVPLKKIGLIKSSYFIHSFVISFFIFFTGDIIFGTQLCHSMIIPIIIYPLLIIGIITTLAYIFICLKNKPSHKN